MYRYINIKTLAVCVIMTVASNLAIAQTAPPVDPALEVFRIRCQIDTDINPVTGLLEPKVQIQAKARADILDGLDVGFLVENITRVPAPLPPNVITTPFELGSATADWDTFPDPGSTVIQVSGDFVEGGESIRVTAQVVLTQQTVADVAECADKTAGQFTQQTKGVCKLKDFNRGKCKSGDILPDGTTQP